MAKKVNKSEAIRAYATENPNSSAKEIVEAMSKKGIEVSAQTVATVKSKAGIKRTDRKPMIQRKKKPGRPAKAGRPAKGKPGRPAKAAAASSDDVSVEALMAAKQLIAKSGTPEQAAAALKVIQKLDAI